LFHVRPCLKIFHIPTSSILYQKSVFDFEIRHDPPTKITLDSSIITSYYLANALTVSPQDLEDQRIVFISDSTVGSTNLTLSLKVICDQDIRLFNEYSGEGQYDYLMIKLSEEFLIYPEFGIGRNAFALYNN
jgi:hypothetical protein